MKRGQCCHPQYAQVDDKCTLCGHTKPGDMLQRLADSQKQVAEAMRKQLGATETASKTILNFNKIFIQ